MTCPPECIGPRTATRRETPHARPLSRVGVLLCSWRMSPADAALFVLVAVLTGVAFYRRYFWVGLILLSLLSVLGFLL